MFDLNTVLSVFIGFKRRSHSSVGVRVQRGLFIFIKYVIFALYFSLRKICTELIICILYVVDGGARISVYGQEPGSNLGKCIYFSHHVF